MKRRKVGIFLVVLVLFLVLLEFVPRLPQVQAGWGTSYTVSGPYSTYNGFGISEQRHVFYALGRHWAFFKGSSTFDIVWTSSTDKVTWAANQTVMVINDNGYIFSVYFDPTTDYVHIGIARYNDIYYRRGLLLSDGNITWSAAQQIIHDTSHIYYTPTVTCDSNGYAVIGYLRGNSSGLSRVPFILKSGQNDGTWSSNATGFPYQLTETTGFARPVVVPLTGGKFGVIWSNNDADVLRIITYNGTDWNAAVASSTNVQTTYFISATENGDDIDIAFVRAVNYNIRHVKYTYSGNSLGTEEAVYTVASNTGIGLSRDAATGDLYIFWNSYPTAKHTYYSKRLAATAVWDSIPSDFLLDAYTNTPGAISVSQVSNSSIISIGYPIQNGSVYLLQYAALNLTANTLFSDGFESGNYAAWTGTAKGGSDTIDVTTSAAHVGTYGSSAYTIASAGESAYCTKTLSADQNVLFFRFYVEVDTNGLDSGDDEVKMASIQSVSGPDLLSVGWDEPPPDYYYWYLSVMNGSSSVKTTFTGPGLTSGTWYCVEVYIKVDGTAGEGSMWIDGTCYATISNVNTTAYGAAHKVNLGIVNTAGTPGEFVLFNDAAVVSDQYVGPAGSQNIGEFQAPSTVYPYQSFMINVTVQAVNGKNTLQNCTLSLNTTGIDLTWLESDNTTAIVDSSNYGELVSSTITTVNGTSFKITWTIKLYWNATEGVYGLDSNTKVFDDYNEMASTTTGSFTFENDLVVNSASVNDGRANPSESLTFTGQLYYEGTSTAPTNTTDISARVELSGVLKGSTTTINSSGYFTIVFNAEASVSNYTYNVYSFTSESSVTNQSVTVKVDRFKILSILCDDPQNRTSINANVVVNVTIQYENDQAVVSTGAFTLNGSALTYGSGVWQATFTNASVVARIYNSVAGSGDTYGLNTVNMNSQSITIIWDQSKVVSYTVSNSHPNVGSNVAINASLIYEYDSAAVTTGTITINGYSASNLGNGVYQITRTSPTVTSVVYDTIAGSETAYGLNIVNQNGQSTTVIWDRLQVTMVANATNPGAGEYINCNVTATYAYSGLAVGSWSFNILRNGTHFASGNFTDYSASNVVCLYSVENVSETAYGLTAFTSNTVTIVWGTLFIEIDQISTVDSRIDIGASSFSYYHCRFSGNLSDCTSGTLYVNSAAFSINSTGWADVSFTFSSVDLRVLNVTDVDVGGIVLYGQIPADPQIVWDQGDAFYFVVDDSHVNVNGTVEVRVRACLSYDLHALESGDSVSVNGSALSWDPVYSWFSGSFIESSAGNWTFTVTSLNEASYAIIGFTQTASSPSAVWDSLVVQGLTLSYLGSGEYQYQAQICYEYSGSEISGASLKLQFPDLATETSVTSNSSGWISFVMSQSNITQTGTWNIYGISDNVAGITVAGQNQTFNMWLLTINPDDWNMSALSGVSLNVYYGNVLVSTASAKMPENTYLVNATWLGLLVNTTSTYSLSASSTLTLQCSAYPFTISGTTYHFASDAPKDSSSFNNASLELQIVFSQPPSAYVLVSDCEPSYVLNCAYDLDVNYTGYLHLSIFGNETLTLGYADWGIRVNRVDHPVASVSWSPGTAVQTFTITIQSSSGSGILEVYCGSRGVPASISGLAGRLYVAYTTMVSGTYTFASPATVILTWGSSGGQSGPTTPIGAVHFYGSLVSLGSIARGRTITFQITVTWAGSTQLQINSVSVVGPNWTLPITMPQTFYGDISGNGTATINVVLTVPETAPLSSQQITFIFDCQSGTAVASLNSVAQFDVTMAPASSSPGYQVQTIIGIALAASLGVVLYSGIRRKKPV